MDVDAGADDAMAILEALSVPGVELIAVTCVHGNTNLTNVVKNVLKTLDTAGMLTVSTKCCSRFFAATFPVLSPSQNLLVLHTAFEIVFKTNYT